MATRTKKKFNRAYKPTITAASKEARARHVTAYPTSISTKTKSKRRGHKK